MPELEEVEQTIEDLAQYHQEIGYDEPDLYEDSQEGAEIRGYTALDDGNGTSIHIVGSPGNRFVSIRYRYDLVEDVAERIGEDAAEKYVGEGGGEDEWSIETQAALNLLSEIDEEEQKNIQYQLNNLILTPRAWGEVQTRDGEFVTGFSVRGRLYPFDHDVSIRDYEYQFSYTVTPAMRGQMFLLYTLNLMNEEDSIGRLKEMSSSEVEDS